MRRRRGGGVCGPQRPPRPAGLAAAAAPVRVPGTRLTALYGILFLVSGAVLLAIASGVAVARSTSAEAAPAARDPGSRTGTALAEAQPRIQALQAQLQNLQARPGQPGQTGSRMSC